MESNESQRLYYWKTEFTQPPPQPSTRRRLGALCNYTLPFIYWSTTFFRLCHKSASQLDYNLGAGVTHIVYPADTENNWRGQGERIKPVQ